MAGYSGTPLARKLGIKAGMRVHLAGPPPGYRATLGPLPPGVLLRPSLRGRLDLVQYFTRHRAGLERRFAALARAVGPDGVLWISWPKLAAKTGTDLRESVVREIGLAGGMVDVKVCAVDDVWSGLKFVRRLRDR